ncbi:MAG: glycosyltransferase [Mycobacterium sp.]
MIGYYIHHQGYGHLARAKAISAHINQPVTALTSLELPTSPPFSRVATLPRDDQGTHPPDSTAYGAVHWAPHHDAGLRDRMTAIAEWVSTARPDACVVDVSVEVATFLRLLGVPVIVVALPGERTDAPHALVHQLADHIIAAWPEPLNTPAWLHPHRHKTSYVGGISRFDGRSLCASRTAQSDHTGVVVLNGRGGRREHDAATLPVMPGSNWQAIGGKTASWEDDPWDQICSADVVVSFAGQGSIADLAVAGRPAVVIPQPRAFDEQHATAAVLERHGLAIIEQQWPTDTAWPQILARARRLDTTAWTRWQTRGAAARAAEAVERTAHRCGIRSGVR